MDPIADVASVATKHDMVNSTGVMDAGFSGHVWSLW